MEDGQKNSDMASNPGPCLGEILSNGVDDLQQKLGGYGRYQMFIFLLLGIVYMSTAWHIAVPVFQGLQPDFHCKASPGLSLNDSVPVNEESSGLWVYEKCKQFINRSLNNETKYCSNGWNMTWEEKGLTSIVSEFSLVCDEDYLVELSTTMFMVGATCAGIFITPFSERFGQKTVMLASVWLQMVIGVALVWAGNIIVFIVFKFFIGILYLTTTLCISILISENFDSTHRTIPALGLFNFWSIGIMSLALLAYLLPDWKNLQLVISIPISAFSLIYIWLVPQSLPWLLSKGKLKEAENVTQRFIRINKIPSIPDLSDHLALFDPKARIDPNTRSLVNALSYFGIIFNTPNLDGNSYLNLFFLGLVEVPAISIGIVVNRIIGRRLSILSFLLICAASNITVVLMPDELDDGTDLTILKSAFVMLGKFGITASYSAIYLYAAEVFPTVLRNQAVGLCCFFENIGSIAAPNVVALHGNLPLIIFGVMSAVCAGFILLLPETHNRPLPHTISEAESRRGKTQTGNG